jgi:hypothetical protein
MYIAIMMITKVYSRFLTLCATLGYNCAKYSEGCDDFWVHDAYIINGLRKTLAEPWVYVQNRNA